LRERDRAEGGNQVASDDRSIAPACVFLRDVQVDVVTQPPFQELAHSDLAGLDVGAIVERRDDLRELGVGLPLGPAKRLRLLLPGASDGVPLLPPELPGSGRALTNKSAHLYSPLTQSTHSTASATAIFPNGAAWRARGSRSGTACSVR